MTSHASQEYTFIIFISQEMPVIWKSNDRKLSTPNERPGERSLEVTSNQFTYNSKYATRGLSHVIPYTYIPVCTIFALAGGPDLAGFIHL